MIIVKHRIDVLGRRCSRKSCVVSPRAAWPARVDPLPACMLCTAAASERECEQHVITSSEGPTYCTEEFHSSSLDQIRSRRGELCVRCTWCAALTPTRLPRQATGSSVVASVRGGGGLYVMGRKAGSAYAARWTRARRGGCLGTCRHKRGGGSPGSSRRLTRDGGGAVRRAGVCSALVAVLRVWWRPPTATAELL